MGDRIAILNQGGRLEQFDTPRAILTSPANAFVEDFLGGERGLKRLGLTTVETVDLKRGPVVDLRDDAGQVTEAMERHGTEWVVVLDGDRLVGWAWGAEVTGTVAEAETRPFWVQLDRNSTLRAALDAVVRSRAHVAVVTDGERYQGMLGLEQIAEDIVS